MAKAGTRRYKPKKDKKVERKIHPTVRFRFEGQDGSIAYNSVTQRYDMTLQSKLLISCVAFSGCEYRATEMGVEFIEEQSDDG